MIHVMLSGEDKLRYELLWTEDTAMFEGTDKMAAITLRRVFRYTVYTLTILLFAAAIVSAKEARDTDVGELSVPQIEDELQVRISNYCTAEQVLV